MGLRRREAAVVPLRDYVERGLDDLARYHAKDTGDLQAEMDRRVGEAQRETTARLGELAARIDAQNQVREQLRDVIERKVDADLYRQGMDSLLTRLDAVESTLDRQRGRIAAYTAVGSILLVAVAILTLVLNHVQF